jgi:small subunit ribosomal protein S4
MGRYTGPVEKLSRREGVELYLKGEGLLAGKSALERRPSPPGDHGRRRTRPSEYQRQLRAKQRAKRYYGLRERQFRCYVDRANRREGILGDHLVRMLELRLDNVVYRLGLASTRAQARQFVTHGHVLVNDRRVDRPGYSLRPGDVVAIKARSPVEAAVRAATELVATVPGWLAADHDALAGHVLREPARGDIHAPVDEQAIVEHYSR